MNDQSSTNGIIAQGRAIFRAQANDQQRVIPYRPQYNLFTGSVTASILLQQIVYWWEINGRKPFYKFKEPCDHDRYKADDSWSEELGFTKYTFDGAIKRIGKKITKGVSKAKAKRENLVIYWTDSNRLTWYQVNEELLAVCVYLAYNRPEILGKQEKPIQIEELEKSGFITSGEKSAYLSSEITQETTTEEKDADALFYGESENPKPKTRKAQLPKTSDPLVLAGHCANVQAREGQWSDASRDIDPWADAYRTFGVAFLPGIDVDRKPEKVRLNQTREIQRLAEGVQATPQQAIDAIKAAAQLESWLVKPSTTPFKPSWAEAFQNVLISDPELLQARLDALPATGGTNGTATAPAPPVKRVNLDELVPGQSFTKRELGEAFARKQREREKAIAEQFPDLVVAT